MVFSSVPAYLDPSNWQPQQINHHQIIGASSATNNNSPLPAAGAAALPPPPAGSGSIRPGSMSERARMANIPMPESALKCPRCESTNTKFCYFNNYSLSQPRHFCKTCRRYWTRGGALRSVPVGGGCRRNKRSSKSSATSSKSSPASSENNTNNNNPSSTTSNNNNNHTTISNGYNGSLLNLTQPQFQPMRFMSPLGQLSEGFAGDMGLGGYGGNNNIPAVTSDHNQMGGGFNGNFLGFEQWKLQQFPFLGGLDPTPPGINYQFHGGESGFLGGGGDVRPKMSSSLLSQLASVKMEEHNNNNRSNPDLSLMSRQLLGGMHQENNEHDQWNNINGADGGGGGAPHWTDLSSFSSSSTSNHLQ